jgi:hypothetical protein
VKFTRAVAIFLFLVYIFLWVLALNGVSSLIPLLAVPAILAVLVAFGVWLNRFMGITPRAQHFQEPDPAPRVEPERPSDAQVDETGEASTNDHGDSTA